VSPTPRVLARPFTVALIAALAMAILPGGTARSVAAVADPGDTVFINEIHYDNASTDAGEAIEIAGPAGTDLTTWSIVLYNGATGAAYDTDVLTGTIDDEGAGYGAFSLGYPVNGIQNGAPDAIALVEGTTVRQFLSYEGVFVGVGGPANGLTSTDIGVGQDGTGATGLSLQLTGTGTTYGDFTWAAEAASSFGTINTGQSFGEAEDSAPTVAETTPADGATGVSSNTAIEIVFSEPVTLDPDAAILSCTDATLAPTGDPAVFEFVYIPPLPDGECTYMIVGSKVHDVDEDDPPDVMAADVPVTFTVGEAADPQVTISQVYGGGGNNLATLRNDFIELFNVGSTDVSVAGWSVQYAGPTGTGAWQVTPLVGEIPVGKHYLVQEAAGANTALPFPVPDATGTIPMGSTGGKVALVKTTTPLSGACPTSADIIDLVGYGAANCFEGSGPTDPTSNTTAALRLDDGAIDTDDNAADFVVGVPNPRPSKEPAPFVSSTFPANAAMGVAKWTTLTVNFSEPVNVTGAWFTIVCATSGTHTVTVAGANTTFLLDPTTDFTGGESCTLTVVAANVTDQDADDPPDTMAADHVVTFTVASDVVCGAPATFIHDVQGDDVTSPITNQVVEIEGVVIGAFPGSIGFQGFHVQEEDADADTDPATSEGIFVFEPNGGATYAVGDQVRVRGRVTEFMTNGVPLTELTNVNNLEVCGAGSTISASDVAMPFETTTEAERFEGMLVGIDQDLTVTETFTLGRFGEVVVSSGGRLQIPTAVVEPGSPEYTALVNLNLRSRLVLDDGDNRQNLDPTLYPIGGLSASDTLRIGDTLEGGSGTFILEQRFGVYRLQPTADLPAFSVGNPRPAAPAAVGGSLRVASMNVLNYFTTLDTNPGSGNGPDICGPSLLECRGASTEFEFDRQRAKVLAALEGLDADVIGLMEIENNDSASVESIVDGLNAELGAGTYAYIDTGTIGTDAIKVAFIYQPAKATPVGDHAILDSDVDPRFIDTLNRPAIAQTFESAATGGQATIIVNHLKSKGSACAGDPDLGDGQGNCNLTRLAAAEALVDWIASDPTGSGDADAIVIGDLNSYTREDPIDVFIGADYDNLIETYVGPDAYSFVFGGESGYLDHALARAGLAAQATGATEWHINADEPIVLDYNTDFKSAGHIETLYAPDAYRSSDHDPVLVGLDLLAYDFGGFQAPANAAGVTEVKAGASLPVKFSLDGPQGTAVLSGDPVFQRHACPTGADIGLAINAVASEPFAYEPATDTYRYTWKTQKAWAGWCGTLTVALADGRSYDLEVTFKP
jgi:predicted extracellular nuclease